MVNLSFLIGLKTSSSRFQEITKMVRTIPETDTGERAEYAKARE